MRLASRYRSFLSGTLEQKDEMPLYGRPFAVDDAEHDGVAPGAVGHELVIAQHRVLLGAEPRDSGARGVVEPVRAKLDRDAREPLECVGQQQQLALGIDRGALRAL